MSDLTGSVANPVRQDPHQWIVGYSRPLKGDQDEPPVAVVQVEGLSPTTVAVAKLFAYGTVTFTDQPAVNDTITINGHDLTFVDTATPGPNEVKILGTLALTLKAAAARVNAAPATYEVTASATLKVLTLTAIVAGEPVPPDAPITIAADATVSGPTLMLPESFVESDPYPAPNDVPIPVADYVLAALFDFGSLVLVEEVVGGYTYLYEGGELFSTTPVLQNYTRRSSIVNFKAAESATVRVFGRDPPIFDVVDGLLQFESVPIDATITVTAYPPDTVFTPKDDGTVETIATPIWSFEVVVTPLIETDTLITFDKRGRVL